MRHRTETGDRHPNCVANYNHNPGVHGNTNRDLPDRYRDGHAYSGSNIGRNWRRRNPPCSRIRWIYPLRPQSDTHSSASDTRDNRGNGYRDASSARFDPLSHLDTDSDPSINSHHNRDNGTAVHLNRNPGSHAHVFANIDRHANAHRVATNTSAHAGTDRLSSTTTPELPTPPLATSTPPVATASALAGATAAIGFDPFGPDKNCGEFEDWASANAFFIAAGGPGDDPHGLDGNDDGVPCQSLPGAP